MRKHVLKNGLAAPIITLCASHIRYHIAIPTAIFTDISPFRQLKIAERRDLINFWFTKVNVVNGHCAAIPIALSTLIMFISCLSIYSDQKESKSMGHCS